MDILKQIQPPYDHSVLSLMDQLQARRLGLKDYPKETGARLSEIIQETHCREVKMLALDIRNAMRTRCVAQMAAMREKTRMAIATRFPDYRDEKLTIEAAFHMSFTTTMSAFAAKADVYIDRCIEVVESLHRKFAPMHDPDVIKDQVMTEVKAMGGNTVPETNFDASQPSEPSQPSQLSQPSEPSQPSQLSQPSQPSQSSQLNCSSHASRLSTTAMSSTDAVDISSSSSEHDVSSDSEESVVSDTSIDSEELAPKRPRIEPAPKAKKSAEEKEAAKIRAKENKLRAKIARKAKRVVDKSKQAEERKLKRAEMNRLKREEKEKVREARKKLRAEKKQAIRTREEKARSYWESWVRQMRAKTPQMRPNDGATMNGHDEKFNKAFAAAERRMQSETPLSPTSIPGPEFTFSGRIPTSSASTQTEHPAPSASRIPASTPRGGVRTNESLMHLFTRLEKIVPYIGTIEGALRFLGASTVDEGKKNYKRMLLAVHTDKLGINETAENKKRACELMDALNKAKAAILELSDREQGTPQNRAPHVPRGLTAKVDSSRVVVLSWEPSSGATRYDVAVYDATTALYHNIAVCEPEYDARKVRYQTLEECTTITLAPASFPKLIHLWQKATMKVQVCAVSHNGVKSPPATQEILMALPYPHPNRIAASDSKGATVVTPPPCSRRKTCTNPWRVQLTPDGVPPLCSAEDEPCTPEPRQGVAETEPTSNKGDVSSAPTPTRVRKAWEKYETGQ